MQSSAFLRIGSRGSNLALVQARLVQRLLSEAHGLPLDAIEIRTITTSGDRLTDAPLSTAGGKGLFSKEIEAALEAGEVDIGVHSSKDMATRLPDGLVLAAFLEREDIRDAFVSLSVKTLDELPQGARLGTSSLRRASQILRARPDLEIVPFRGNVDTRLRKLTDGVADATLLAVAGLNRLGRASDITDYLDPERFLPAPAQGAIGLEIRADDSRSFELIAPLNHQQTATAVHGERALLDALDGSCRTAIGVVSHIAEKTLMLRGEILSPDGRISIEARHAGPAAAPEAVGHELGQILRDKAGSDFLKLFPG
ncbi:hydroxymethylbilane synthase [Devosia sp. 66-22]|uniref:hydroxymethylbilane synthase n=1 Tax=Devosia sp. 66-22 TaxID=1895753 RepID=UPI0009294E79|nr:hydroxymethylbilane synthase [Devosia sp. 66-22]OJX46422.1 MAG: hydroxymethylbilane synthase [Devosia sp. 66-22]